MTDARPDEEEKQKHEAYQIKKGKKDTTTKPNKAGKCFSCGKAGHYAKQCRNKERKTDRNKEKPIALLADVEHITPKDAWLIDSAPTHHVCRHKEWFENLRRIESEPIDTTETTTHQIEETLTAEGIGSINLQARIGNKTISILQNVYYAPKCRRNLMSVAQIEKARKKIEFDKGMAYVVNIKTGERIIEAYRRNNLYIVQADVVNPKNDRLIKLHTASIAERDLGIDVSVTSMIKVSTIVSTIV